MISHAALNASLNGVSAILLAGGYAAIRSGKIAVHKMFMIAAFTVSSVFLVSYLVYHYRVGHVAFAGQGWIRPVYFVLLLTHTILAIVIADDYRHAAPGLAGKIRPAPDYCAVDFADVVLCERDRRDCVFDGVSIL